MRFRPIAGARDLVERVDELGILPFFRCGIKGLSVEELTPDALWFQKGVDGPWEWRQEAIGEFAYAKLFRGKAGFVSRAWFPSLANYRRGGMDFDGRYAEGRMSALSRRLYELIGTAPRSTPELKRLAGADSGYDRAIVSLMMSTDVVILGFDKALDAFGRPYGWGISRYAAAEAALGERVAERYGEPPETSFGRMRDHLLRLCPGAESAAVERLLRA